MNEHFSEHDKNSSQVLQNEQPSHPELINDFHRIIGLVTKTLTVSIGVIAAAKGDNMFITSNHPLLDGKIINLTKSILTGSPLSPASNFKDSIFNEVSSHAKSYVGCAMLSKSEKIIGFFAVANETSREFSPDEVLLLEDFAKLTSEIAEKHNAAQKLQEVFTDFVHKTVHDLKNPFTTISLTTELLKRKADDVKLVASFSQRLENANNKVLMNLERLKSAFPLTSENFRLNIEEINVEKLLLKVNEKINLKAATTNEVKDKLYGDYRRLTEALVQLTIHLSTVSKDLANLSLKAFVKENQAIFAVSNAGTDDNQTEERELTKSTHLSIAKKLIQMHYGEVFSICYDNAEKYTFYAALPLPS